MTQRDPFFVGYLNMPARLKKFYTPLAVLLVVLAAFAGYTLAGLQKTAGPAEWQTHKTETITGYLALEPYPVLHRANPARADEVESILLVKQGKFSASDAAREFAGRMVSITGFPIRRGGWFMLELNSPDAITLSDARAADIQSRIRPVSLGRVELAGEVADSKCFLGVMKPGAGPVHRACAEVCLLGGIPAMLLVRGADAKKYGYMLTRADGGNASREVAGRAGETLRVRGELLQRGDLLYLKAEGAL